MLGLSLSMNLVRVLLRAILILFNFLYQRRSSLLNQKSLSTYTDWNIKAGASETFTGGEDVGSRAYKDLISTKYEIGATRKVENSGASVESEALDD